MNDDPKKPVLPPPPPPPAPPDKIEKKGFDYDVPPRNVPPEKDKD